jgi:hypothetical protein
LKRGAGYPSILDRGEEYRPILDKGEGYRSILDSGEEYSSILDNSEGTSLLDKGQADPLFQAEHLLAARTCDWLQVRILGVSPG